jgi:YesN/AraC family two-component response regulator
VGEILVMDCEDRGAFWVTLKSDHPVHFVTTANEGLDMLSEKTGLVFLSLRLMDMSGLEVLSMIKKEHPSTPVIMISSCGTEETCIEAFRRGARDYLRVPLDAEEILYKIGILMKLREAAPQRRRFVSLAREKSHEEYYPDIPSHLVSGVLRVRDYVAQNYSESLTLSAACKMATTSKTYFCRFFKRITGHSLRNYHHVVKMQIAEELLRDKRLSVTDVAIRLGYDDSNYFSTMYKKITGTCPRQRQASDQHLEENREVLDRVQGNVSFLQVE